MIEREIALLLSPNECLYCASSDEPPGGHSPLVRHFVHEFARRMNKTIDGISSETMEWLTRYSWPGNIRELQNVIERSVVVHQKGTLSVKRRCFPHAALHIEPTTRRSLRKSVAEDRRMIDEALAEAEGHVSGPSGAAAILGLPASTLESKIRSLNINKHSFKTVSRNSSRTSRIHETIELL